MTTEMNMKGQIELRDSAAIANLRRNLNGAVEIKNRYDPDNLFQVDQNITPQEAKR